MRQRLSFYAYLAQLRFAEALAQRKPGDWPADGWELWAAYRLGLYHTVAQAPWDGRHLKGGVAMAVSLAACGHADDARQVVQRLLARHGQGRYRHELADALAPFDPELALSLLDAPHTPSVLYLALQLRTGQAAAAAASLHKALEHGHSARQPELWLLATNALGGSPDEQLARLNAWLGHFGLPPLALRDAALPPAPGNLCARQAPTPVAGGPLVSVLMTAYNAADRIGAALEGLLNQSWQNLEVLVADDASHDDTVAVVQAVAARDARVRLLRMPCNVGTYAAKTAALALAQGEFVTCHDADDWSHPLRIEQQVQPLLKNPRLVATTSKWVRMEDNGSFYARPVHPLARLNPASPLFRRELVLQRTGAWDCVRTGADSEFHTRLRLVFGRQAVLRMKQPLALGSHRPNSLMTAQDTGYTASGISPNRLAYWEAWTHWHIDCLRQGHKPVMPPWHEARAFAVPPAIAVPAPNLAHCLAGPATVPGA